jgi:hypothetical protein
MIQNYDKFSRWNVKFSKIYTFKKIIFIQQWLILNMWSIGQLYVFLIQVAKDFIQKFFHMKKWEMTKQDSQSFCEVIPLTPICVLAPD